MLLLKTAMQQANEFYDVYLAANISLAYFYYCDYYIATDHKVKALQ